MNNDNLFEVDELLVLLFLMPYAGLIPMPTIAAILFMVAYNMSEWKKFVHTLKSRKDAFDFGL